MMPARPGAGEAGPVGRAWLVAVMLWWVALGAAGAAAGPGLSLAWPAWPWAFGAAALWGVNALLVAYGIGRPLRVSRPPILAAVFALAMTVLGSGSYWATIQLYPAYRVSIERAAWLVAACTAVALAAVVAAQRLTRSAATADRARLEWDWSRLGAVTLIVFAAAALGTVAAVRRIGYVPVLSGDPASARVDFPGIGGIWYRLSMLGGVAAILVAVQAAARRASGAQYLVGLASLGMVGVYGPRFFVVLPLAVALLLWDRLRTPLRLGRAAILLAVAAPLLAVLGYWRSQDQSVRLPGPAGLLLYGTLGEFRDLGWTIDYYSLGDRFAHGATLGSLIVPLLPSPVWSVVGIDKASIYARDSATLLADAMGQTTGQRVGAYGEFFMNFGWAGAIAGAILYGVLLSFLDRRSRRLEGAHVAGVFLCLTIATAVFAQIGQLNMFTSTLTGLGYPLALVVLVAARRRSTAGTAP
jgi:hypothetical protein